MVSWSNKNKEKGLGKCPSFAKILKVTEGVHKNPTLSVSSRHAMPLLMRNSSDLSSDGSVAKNQNRCRETFSSSCCSFLNRRRRWHSLSHLEEFNLFGAQQSKYSHLMTKAITDWFFSSFDQSRNRFLQVRLLKLGWIDEHLIKLSRFIQCRSASSSMSLIRACRSTLEFLSCA